MDESLYNLVNQLFSFLTVHFYEIILILLVFVVIDVALFFLAKNKKEKIIVLHSNNLLGMF